MFEFENGQAYAQKQEGDGWQYLAGLKAGQVIEVYIGDQLVCAEYEGVRPRNRKYPVLIYIGRKGYKLPVSSVKLPDDDEWAVELYLENLRRRHEGQPFGGLPNWQKAILTNNEDVLPDELCKVVSVPIGSTIGESIRRGMHYGDFAEFAEIERQLEKKYGCKA
jgi:hypothetical protein